MSLLTACSSCTRLTPISCQTLLFSNPCLYRLYLTLDKLLKNFGWHPSPALLQDKFEDRIIKKALWLASHSIKHALVLILLNQLSQSAWLDQQLKRFGDLMENVAEDLVV